MTLHQARQIRERRRDGHLACLFFVLVAAYAVYGIAVYLLTVTGL